MLFRLTNTPVSILFQVSILFLALIIQGCSSPSRYKILQDHGPTDPVDVSHVKNAVPKTEPRSKYGNAKNYNVRGKWYTVRQDSNGYSEKGIASWYGKKFHGHRTSSGETYDMYAMTAAHKTLPLPTYVQVTHLQSGKSVIVKVNDRGPFHDNRIIDLSYSAAKKLGVTSLGTAAVEVTAIDPEKFKQRQNYQPKVARHSALSTYPVEKNYKLYLQVGAFISQQNAARLQKRLSGMFKASRIRSDFSPDKNVYRIRIGPFANVTEADKLSILLNNKGIHSSQIVID